MAYAPAGNTTGTATLRHLATVFYKKTSLEHLLPMFRFREACMEDDLPLRSGKTCQWHRFNPFSVTGQTTATTEGAVGTSLTVDSNVVSSSVSQYANFITVSDLLEDTDIVPSLKNASGLLGELAGLVVDTITRTTIDNEYSNVSQTPLGGANGYLSAKDLKASTHIMGGVNVPPMGDGLYFAVIHPYVEYDLLADGQAGSVYDTYKYTNPDKTGAIKNTFHAGTSTVIQNCRVTATSNVKATSGSPNTWDNYVFGKAGVGFLNLAGRGPSKMMDPSKETFNIRVVREGPDNPSIANPEGKIAGACSYNFKFSTVVLEGPTAVGGQYRFRIIRTASSIVA